MKFLSIAKPKDILYALPPAAFRQLLESSLAVMKKQKKEGKILEYYYSPTGCTIIIVDYESANEWVKDQLSIPILSYYDQENYPLTDLEEVSKSFSEALKAAEKLATPK